MVGALGQAVRVGATQLSFHAVHFDKVLPGDEEVLPLRARGRWLIIEVRVTAPAKLPVKWAEVDNYGNRLRTPGRTILPDGSGTSQAEYKYGSGQDVEVPAGETQTRPLAYDVEPSDIDAVHKGTAAIEFVDGVDVNPYRDRNQVKDARHVGVLRIPAASP